MEAAIPPIDQGLKAIQSARHKGTTIGTILLHTTDERRRCTERGNTPFALCPRTPVSCQLELADVGRPLPVPLESPPDVRATLRQIKAESRYQRFNEKLGTPGAR